MFPRTHPRPVDLGEAFTEISAYLSDPTHRDVDSLALVLAEMLGPEQAEGLCRGLRNIHQAVKRLRSQRPRRGRPRDTRLDAAIRVIRENNYQLPRDWGRVYADPNVRVVGDAVAQRKLREAYRMRRLRAERNTLSSQQKTASARQKANVFVGLVTETACSAA